MLPTAGNGAGGASTRAEAERRRYDRIATQLKVTKTDVLVTPLVRALALKALDARVASTGAAPPASGAVNSTDVPAGGDEVAAKEAVPEDGTGVPIFKESGDKAGE